MTMELRHLRYFVAVAEELHFGRAARRLRIAEPPLSVQIRQFEEELGAKLLERTSRRVVLTAAGAAFLDEAKSILRHVARASEEVRLIAAGTAGTLHFGLAGWGASEVLAPLVARYVKAFPAVELLIAEMTTKMAIEALTRREIDLGAVSASVDPDEFILALAGVDGISHCVLRRESFVVALPRRHPLARQKALPISALDGEPLALISDRACPGIHHQIIRRCERAGFVPKIMLDHCETQTPFPFVAEGLALAVMPSHYQERRIVGVVLIPLVEKDVALETKIAWNTKSLSPTATEFLRIAQEGAL